MVAPVLWIEVDLNKIAHNIKSIESYLGSKTRLVIEVQADGFGHGSIPVVKLLRGRLNIY